MGCSLRSCQSGDQSLAQLEQAWDTLPIFLKGNRRHKNGETYEYWTLVETVRTLKGPRQRTVCHLGKLPGLDKRHRQSWENITYLLDGEEPPEVQTDFENSLQSDNNRGKGDPSPQWLQVGIKGLRIEKVRDFGEVYLALAVWRRLGLPSILQQIIPVGGEKVS